jgi:hypothetical protein
MMRSNGFPLEIYLYFPIVLYNITELYGRCQASTDITGIIPKGYFSHTNPPNPKKNGNPPFKPPKRNTPNFQKKEKLPLLE